MQLPVIYIILAVSAAVGSAADDAKPNEQCGQLSSLSGDGELVSHKDFAKCTYPVGLKCTWDIVANLDNVNSRLSFSFEEYEMPQGSKPCAGSFLKAYADDDTSKPAIQSMCEGRNLPAPFNSTSNKVRLVFESSDIGAKGFLLKWKMFRIIPTCDPVTEHKCKNGFNCYKKGQKCDGGKDCSDGSDEVGCTPATCTGGEFKCGHGLTCIPRAKLCDGSKDCRDGSDEDACTKCNTGDFRCLNKKCVAGKKACNILDDCGDKSDEFGCTKEQLCKADLLRCNGAKDCGDGSDEKGCPHESGGPPCLLNHVLCRTSKYCIKSSLACNGVDDCKDNSDEENCPADVCKEPWHQCANTQFITKSKVCDGTPHCADGSDEKSCSKP